MRNKNLLTVLGLLVLFHGCSPGIPAYFSVPEGGLDEKKIQEIETWAEDSQNNDERAGRLFLLADASYRYSQQLNQPGESSGESQESNNPGFYRQKAEGALLRIVELGVGPVEAARHNLAVLFQETRDSSPKENSSPSQEGQKKQEPEEGQDTEPRDLSSLVRQRPEEDRRKEEILEREQNKRLDRENQASGNPIPLSEDW